MKFRHIDKALKESGWQLVRQKGSHWHYRHSLIPGTVTIPYKGNSDLQLGTLKAIQKQAQQRIL